MKNYYVYILQCGDGTLYTGYTGDVPRRVALHNRGKGAKYTRSRLPAVLAYQEALPDKSAAMKREAAIKKLTRPEKLALISKKEPFGLTKGQVEGNFYGLEALIQNQTPLVDSFRTPNEDEIGLDSVDLTWNLMME
ncbi:MAG: GIY-YIG nuclease family protein [Oscillospiraceae bacterium]|nr:GIY-YIG nuclease family protein [Oscillospiraceae bacterium]